MIENESKRWKQKEQKSGKVEAENKIQQSKFISTIKRKKMEKKRKKKISETKQNFNEIKKK